MMQRYKFQQYDDMHKLRTEQPFLHFRNRRNSCFSHVGANLIGRSFVNLCQHNRMTNEHESYFLKTTEPTACVSAV